MRLALLFCLFVTPALADGVVIISPVYSQLVAVAVPAEFKPVSEVEKDGTYVLELAPQGQSLENWTQLITLTGVKGQAAGLAAISAASQLAKGYQDACPDSFSARSLPIPTVKGAAEVFAGFLGCGTAQGTSQAMVFLVLKGAQDIYTVQWAERGAARSQPIEPDQATWRPRAETLALTRVCDPVPGEAAPYPTCTQ